MNPQTIVTQSQTKLTQAIAHFQEELKRLRTGRAHPSMLEGVMVTAYGQSMPLIQLASITTPEAQLLQISPFDPSTIQAISGAIRDNPSLGLNPMDDGRVVRVPVPALTTDRRQQITKQLREKVEECLVAMRGVRHDALKDADQAKKDKLLSEDDYKRLEKQVDELMAKHKSEVEALAKAKETEIMTV
jgi:ribosome recycling factor